MCDGARVIAEYNGASQLLRKYVYGPGLDEPVMMQVGTTRYYYLFDSLGSVIGLTDATGDLLEAYRYNVFGQPLQASTVGNPYMFTGRRFDSETGLYYYRARYYSPQLRRFIEPDPIGFEGGMNLYAYVGNDPGNTIDPYGLWGISYGGSLMGIDFSATLYDSNIGWFPNSLTNIGVSTTAFGGGIQITFDTPIESTSCSAEDVKCEYGDGQIFGHQIQY